MIRIVYRDIDSYSVQRLIVYRFLRAHFLMMLTKGSLFPLSDIRRELSFSSSQATQIATKEMVSSSVKRSTV